MERLKDSSLCREVTDKYPEYFTWDAEDWFSNDANFAYKEGDNVAFGEWKSPGTYWVHFCFHTARGREAIELTKEMLSELYRDTHFESAVGLISEDNRKARWLIRQVGFSSLGIEDTENGPCEIFYVTRNYFNGI